MAGSGGQSAYMLLLYFHYFTITVFPLEKDVAFHLN